MVRTATLAAVEDDLAANIESFARHLRAERKAQKTIDVYRAAADDLHRFLSQMGMPLVVANIRREHVEAYLGYLRDRITGRGRPTSPATMNQYHRSLQQFFKYLIADDEIKDSPLKNVAPPTIPDVPPAVMSMDTMKALLRACDGKTFQDRRDNAILTLFYDSGIRLAEMAGIHLTDLDLDAMQVWVTGKFDRPRLVRFSPQTVRTIDRYIKLRGGHPDRTSTALWLGERGPLTISGISLMVKRRARQAGVEHVHPHAFRHAFADSYLEAGGQENALMQQAGWRTRAMVDRYARGKAAERARKNYDEFSPMERLRRA
jgi:site-specific recombinase XerD